MAGIEFLSKILGLKGLIIRKNPSNRQVLVDLSSSQVSDTALTVNLPYKDGTLLLSPPTAGVFGQILSTNGDGTTSWQNQGSNTSIKTGIVSSASFTQPSPDSDYEYTVVFGTAYPDTIYAVLVTGVDQRNWSYSNKTVNGFKIKTNSKTALAGEVSWFTNQPGG